LKLTNRQITGITYLAIVLAILVILLLSQQWITTTFIPYLQYLYEYTAFLAIVFLNYLDQYLIWGTFIILSVIATIVRLIRIYPQEREEPEKLIAKGRVYMWWSQVSNWDEGMYFRWQFSQRFAPLLLDTLSRGMGLSMNQGKNMLENDDLEAPDIVLEYLKAAYNKRILDYFSTERVIIEKPIGLNINSHQLLDKIEITKQ
jgi:hypothetical protein